MHLAYTAEQEALRRELRQYFQALMTPEVETECAAGETGGPASLEAVRKMGRDGWLGPGRPAAWGGQGRTGVAEVIFFKQALPPGAPIPVPPLPPVGPPHPAFGSQA